MNSKSNAKCANCQEGGYECTYIENAKRRGPPKGYIETLEQRCGRLEKVLAQVSHHVARAVDGQEHPPTCFRDTILAIKSSLLMIASPLHWPG